MRPLLQRLPFKRILFFASIWLLLWFLSGVSRVRFVEEHSFSRVLFYILFLIVLVFGGISGFFIILTRLHNPKSKEIWKRIVLLGIPLKSTFITGGSLLPLEFTFRNPLIYPPSVVEYFHVINREYSDLWDQVVDVLSSGILGLLANGTIQVRQCERFSSWGWGNLKPDGKEYIYSAKALPTETPLDGALERRLLSVIGGWSRPGRSAEWPDGPSTYELIRAVYQHDVDTPVDWVRNLVAEDMVSQAWEQLAGEIIQHSHPSTSRGDALNSAWQIFYDYYAQIYHQQHEFLSTLNDEIKKAIKSRRAIALY